MGPLRGRPYSRQGQTRPPHRSRWGASAGPDADLAGSDQQQPLRSRLRRHRERSMGPAGQSQRGQCSPDCARGAGQDPPDRCSPPEDLLQPGHQIAECTLNQRTQRLRLIERFLVACIAVCPRRSTGTLVQSPHGIPTPLSQRWNRNSLTTSPQYQRKS